MNEFSQYIRSLFNDPSVLIYLLSVFLPAIFTWLQRLIELKKQKTKVERAEKFVKEEAEKQETIVKYIEAIINLANEREKLTMLRAQGRASVLFGIGTALMVLSVFAPILSWVAYLSTEPITDETIRLTKTLKEQLGIIPSYNEIAAQRDWRILLSGVSFGFLFLAAARGILRQEGQQMATFLNLARRVTYFENIVNALKIAERNELERIGQLPPESRSMQPDLQQYIKRIIDMLFQPPQELALLNREDKKTIETDDLPIKSNLASIVKSTK